jgi:hypothetical protein
MPGPAGRLRSWTRAFVRSNPMDTLSLLKDPSAGVSECITYQSREDEGARSPTYTLDRVGVPAGISQSCGPCMSEDEYPETP